MYPPKTPGKECHRGGHIDLPADNRADRLALDEEHGQRSSNQSKGLDSNRFPYGRSTRLALHIIHVTKQRVCSIAFRYRPAPQVRNLPLLSQLRKQRIEVFETRIVHDQLARPFPAGMPNSYRRAEPL